MVGGGTAAGAGDVNHGTASGGDPKACRGRNVGGQRAVWEQASGAGRLARLARCIRTPRDDGLSRPIGTTTWKAGCGKPACQNWGGGGVFFRSSDHHRFAKALRAPQRVLLACALPFLLSASHAGPPGFDAIETSQPPVLDGRLDDPCWQTAPALTNFTQVLPVEGAPPSERTELRVVFTADHLYIAVRCFDSEPGRILATQMRRDAWFNSDDVVSVAFDTFARGRDGYLFAVNPAGARRDALFSRFGGENTDWDTVWDARARVDDQGWTVEIAIPFKSLSFDPRAGTWRWNVERVIRRKQETARWTALSRAKAFTALEDFGELRGLRGLRQGLGIEVRPYARGTYTDDGVTGGRRLEFKSGFDVTYRITPTLTALGTYNTDFAETEVDGRVVSLSRFPVFFPEKRDFFLQDAPLFSFGGLPAGSSPFYSRRIGLGVDGRPVDIIGGGRLTGRAGGTSVALLNVYQDAHAGLEAKNLAVARVSQQALAESSVGGIFTFGDPRSNSDAWLGGLDFNYQNSRLPGGNVLAGSAWFMFSDAARAGGGDTAFGFEAAYPNEPLDARIIFRQWGGQFDPPLGFIDRPGVREYIGSVRHIWRPNTRWVRSVELGAQPFFTSDLGNRIVAEEHEAPVLTIRTPAGDELEMEAEYNRDVVDEAFEIWPGVTVPAGDYGHWQFDLSLETSPARPVSAGLSLDHGDFYSGRHTAYRSSLDWRPSRHVTLGAAYELRQVRLLEGDFDVHLASLRFNLALTPDLTWSTIAQYDNRSDDAGFNSRIRWTWRPGNDMFLVWNQVWNYDNARFARLTSEVMLKAGATFRF